MHIPRLPARRQNASQIGDPTDQALPISMRKSVGLSGEGFTCTLPGFCRRITPPVCAEHNDRASRGATRRIVRSAPTSSTRFLQRVLALFVLLKSHPTEHPAPSLRAGQPAINRLLYCDRSDDDIQKFIKLDETERLNRSDRALYPPRDGRELERAAAD